MSRDPVSAAGGLTPPVERVQLVGRLEAHPFLRDLARAHLATLAECASTAEFVAGEWIFQEGERANRFYLILEGGVALHARLPAGGTRVIERLGAGEVLGWSWLFPPYRWHFAAEALTPTRAIFVYGSRLLECCEADPALGYELTKRMAAVAIGRLQSVRGQLAAAGPGRPD